MYKTIARALRPLRAMSILVLALVSVTVASANQQAGEQFTCPDTAIPETESMPLWSRYGRTLENHRCSESILQLDALERDWEVNGLGEATGTPVIAGELAYFGDAFGVLHAVDAEQGTEIWTTSLGAEIRSTPVVDKGVVYFAAGAMLHAANAEDGTLLWSTLLDPHPRTLIDSSPVVVDGLVVVGVSSSENFFGATPFTFTGSVVALDTTTGAEVWRIHTQKNDGDTGAGGGIWSSPAVDTERKMLYIGTGQAYSAPAGPLTDAVLAIDYELGELVWFNQYTEDDVWSIPPNGPGPDADIGASPTLMTADGQDLVLVGSKASIFKAMDRDTGATVWERVLGPGSTLGGVMTSAATDGERLFVTANSWVDFGFFGGVHSPNDTSTAFALDPATGETQWSVVLPAPMFGALAVADGVVFLGLINGEVRGLDAATGAEVFYDVLPGPIGGGMSIARGRVYASYGFDFAGFVTPDAGVVSWR